MDTLLSYAVKYGPELVVDVVDALKKKGITIAEVEQQFSGVKPYDSLGINPNAPVKPA